MNQDSAAGRGVKTIVQTIIGSIVGLALAVWAVPGVPGAVTNYISGHIVEILLLVGIPSGVASFVWNLLRKEVPNF